MALVRHIDSSRGISVRRKAPRVHKDRLMNSKAVCSRARIL